MMRPLPTYVALSCLLLMPAGEVAAAEFRLTPTFAITEDVTDNINETHSHRQAEFQTVLQPGAGFSYATPYSQMHVAYNLDYRYYARNTRNNEVSHTMAALGTFALVGQFLKLDISDTFSRIPLDVARDTTAESSNHAQDDQNTATFSPYLDWRLTEKTGVKTGGRFTDIRYWSNTAIDKQTAGGFVELNHQISPRLALSARYVYDRTTTEPVIVIEPATATVSYGSVNYTDNSVSGGFTFEYAERSTLFCSVGNSWQSFSYRSGASNLLWDVGISNQFRQVAVTLESKSRFTEDPLAVSVRQMTHSLRIDKVMQRGTLGFLASYDDYKSAGDTGVIIVNPGAFDPIVGSGVSTSDENRHGVTISLTGSRELRPDLTSSFTVTGDRISRTVSLDYPYHLAVTGALNYLVGPATSAYLAYTYATYRHELGSANDSVNVNRLVVTLKRSF